MSRLLFVGPDHGGSIGGREQLSRLHGRALQETLGDTYDSIFLPRSSLRGVKAIIAALTGRIDGVDAAAKQRIMEHITKYEIDRVWINGSNLGALASSIKRQFPRVRVITFFHNVEPRFFIGALKQRYSVRTIGIIIATFLAERLGVRASDQLVMLNERDSHLSERLYGRAATDLLPMSIEEPAGGTGECSDSPMMENYLLFVGGGFYANQAGILWFAQHVAPRLAIPTLIVGRGLEPLRSIISSVPNIVLVGEVNDLGPYYRHATAVVAPIFDGSGMKTKVAEALMYGKRIAGTAEAFIGYEDVVASAGWQCSSADDFVFVLSDVAALGLPLFDPAIRLRFEELYSYGSACRRIATIIGLPHSTIDNHRD